jgi:hypothetical protein
MNLSDEEVSNVLEVGNLDNGHDDDDDGDDSSGRS